MNLIFGQKKEVKEFCPICGLAIYDDKGCPRYHKLPRKRQKRYSGKSKSENKFNEYN